LSPVLTEVGVELYSNLRDLAINNSIRTNYKLIDFAKQEMYLDKFLLLENIGVNSSIKGNKNYLMQQLKHCQVYTYYKLFYENNIIAHLNIFNSLTSQAYFNHNPNIYLTNINYYNINQNQYINKSILYNLSYDDKINFFKKRNTEIDFNIFYQLHKDKISEILNPYHRQFIEYIHSNESREWCLKTLELKKF